MMTNMMMIEIAGGVVVLGGLVWWFLSPSESTTRKSREEIVQLLEAQGYKVKEIEFDDGVYEVEAYKDGEEVEIKLDPTGKILKVEKDD